MWICKALTDLPGDNKLKTHCKRGHEFTPDNLIKRKYGRDCKACARLRSKQRRLSITDLSEFVTFV